MTVVKILLLFGLTVISIALAAVEAAFYLVKRRRLGHVSLHNPRAEMANRYLDDPPALLMPVHMGTYTAHVAMTVVITSLFLDLMAYWAMFVAFGFMVIYLLVCRLSIPYTLVRRNPERTLLRLLPAFDVYARALAPLVAALRQPQGGPSQSHDSEERPAVPPVEVPPAPVHDPDEGRLMDAVARFGITQVREVMTPRP